MSYIFVDVDEARRCGVLISSKTEQLRALITDEADESGGKLADFCRRLDTLSADLLDVTETYAAEDEKMKALHLMTNDTGSRNNAE